MAAAVESQTLQSKRVNSCRSRARCSGMTPSLLVVGGPERHERRHRASGQPREQSVVEGKGLVADARARGPAGRSPRPFPPPEVGGVVPTAKVGVEQPFTQVRLRVELARVAPPEALEHLGGGEPDGVRELQVTEAAITVRDREAVVQADHSRGGHPGAGGGGQAEHHRGGTGVPACIQPLDDGGEQIFAERLGGNDEEVAVERTVHPAGAIGRAEPQEAGTAALGRVLDLLFSNWAGKPEGGRHHRRRPERAVALAVQPAVEAAAKPVLGACGEGGVGRGLCGERPRHAERKHRQQGLRGASPGRVRSMRYWRAVPSSDHGPPRALYSWTPLANSSA